MPGKELEHLNLPSIDGLFERRTRRGGPYTITHRNHDQFAKKMIQKLDGMSKIHASKKPSSGYVSGLVFKIKTTVHVPDQMFRDELERTDVETMISKSGKGAEWVVYAHDPDLGKLKNKIKNRSKRSSSNFVDGIYDVLSLTPDDRLGSSFRMKPFKRNGFETIVISFMKIDNDTMNQKLESLLREIRELIVKHNCKLYDDLHTDNLDLLMISCTYELFEIIRKFDLVLLVDRLDTFDIDDPAKDMEKINLRSKVSDSINTGILIMDSGVVRHPLLDGALQQIQLGLESKTGTLMQHGTKVAGAALYGNIDDANEDDVLETKFQIFSSKIFYETKHGPELNPKKLYYTSVKESIEHIAENFPECRIVTIAFGNTKKIMFEKHLQHELATLIDDLSISYPNLIFVISMGNIDEKYVKVSPNWLHDHHDKNKIRLLDPASSVHALSIGSLQKTNEGNVPSGISRIGPGLNDMIKPDLVEIGGSDKNQVRTLNPNFYESLTNKSHGTSYSAPFISNHLARLTDVFPNYSRNLIISLLMSSARYPALPSKQFPILNSTISNKNFRKISNFYGYGMPILENALHSSNERVALLYDGNIGLNKVKFFKINIPQEFALYGRRHISVSLVYDPNIDRTNSSYFDPRLEFHVFRNRTIQELRNHYVKISPSQINSGYGDVVPLELKCDEINLTPGNAVRKLSPHQKGIRPLGPTYKMMSGIPITIVVVCRYNWKKTASIKKQRFALAVTLESERKIDLYEKLRNLNRIQPASKVYA